VTGSHEDGGTDSTDEVSLPQESIEDLYEHAPCSYLSTLLDGRIIRVNQTFLKWTGYDRDALLSGRRLQDLLTPGGRIFHQTHVELILRVEGSAREIAAEIRRADGSVLPVLLNATRRDVPSPSGPVPLVRFTLLDATERRRYEKELLEARRRAEEVLRKVRTLEGLLPMCAWCRRVRSDQGYWQKLEE
jgi:serine/threonine-protein kinase RsbW